MDSLTLQLYLFQREVEKTGTLSGHLMKHQREQLSHIYSLNILQGKLFPGLTDETPLAYVQGYHLKNKPLKMVNQWVAFCDDKVTLKHKHQSYIFD